MKLLIMSFCALFSQFHTFKGHLSSSARCSPITPACLLSLMWNWIVTHIPPIQSAYFSISLKCLTLETEASSSAKTWVTLYQLSLLFLIISWMQLDFLASFLNIWASHFSTDIFLQFGFMFWAGHSRYRGSIPDRGTPSSLLQRA
jgi:hypothetical protein